MRRIALFSVVLTAAFITGTAQGQQAAKLPPSKPIPIAERMTKPVEFKFEATPLKVVVENLKTRLKVAVVLDAKALEEAKFSLGYPISGSSAKDGALESINRVLNPEASRQRSAMTSYSFRQLKLILSGSPAAATA